MKDMMGQTIYQYYIKREKMNILILMNTFNYQKTKLCLVIIIIIINLVLRKTVLI